VSLSPISRATPQALSTATLTIETRGIGFIDHPRRHRVPA
jgi:hypothetical protein